MRTMPIDRGDWYRLGTFQHSVPMVPSKFCRQCRVSAVCWSFSDANSPDLFEAIWSVVERNTPPKGAWQDHVEQTCQLTRGKLFCHRVAMTMGVQPYGKRGAF